MPPTRSNEMLAVCDRLQEILQTASPGERLDLARLRLDFADLQLGAQCNYLHRAVREAVGDGRLERAGSGSWIVPDAPEAPEAAEAAEAPEAEVPAVDATFRMPSTLRAYLPRLRAVIDAGDRIAIRMTGPAGAGKTEAASQVAASLSLPIVTLDCSLVRDPVEVFGGRTLSSGSVRWEDSAIAQAIAAGNAVVLLDELNRASPEVANALLPLLDRRGTASLADRPTPLRAGKAIVWIATCNVGVEYTGTGRIDRAVEDRFSRTFELSYLSEADETALLVDRTGIESTLASRLASVAAASRVGDMSRPISTRMLIAAAEDYESAGVEAVRATLLHSFPPSIDRRSDRSVVASLLTGQGFEIGGTQ